MSVPDDEGLRAGAQDGGSDYGGNYAPLSEVCMNDDASRLRTARRT